MTLEIGSMKLEEIGVTKEEFEKMYEKSLGIVTEVPQKVGGVQPNQKFWGCSLLMVDSSITASSDLGELLDTKRPNSVILNVERNGGEIKFGENDYDKSIKGLNNVIKAVLLLHRPAGTKEVSEIQSENDLEISGRTLDWIRYTQVKVPIIYCNGAGTKYYIFESAESAVFNFRSEDI